MLNLEESLKATQAAAMKLENSPDNDSLLELSLYYKQATESDVSGPKLGRVLSWQGPGTTPGRPARGLMKEAGMQDFVKLVEYLQPLE